MPNPEAESRIRGQEYGRSNGASADARAWVLTLILLTAADPSLAQDPSAAFPAHGAPPADRRSLSRSETPWLDEVRTQRQAWEDRRQATRDAFEASRRLADPQGAAHQEAWEEDVRRRREAHKQHMVQDRQRFRVLGQPSQPWYASQNPARAPDTTGTDRGERSDQPTVPHPDTRSLDTATVFDPPAASPADPHAPQIWDNSWYYRGY
jgi:hypothetical protein